MQYASVLNNTEQELLLEACFHSGFWERPLIGKMFKHFLSMYFSITLKLIEELVLKNLVETIKIQLTL